MSESDAAMPLPEQKLGDSQAGRAFLGQELIYRIFHEAHWLEIYSYPMKGASSSTLICPRLKLAWWHTLLMKNACRLYLNREVMFTRRTQALFSRNVLKTCLKRNESWVKDWFTLLIMELEYGSSQRRLDKLRIKLENYLIHTMQSILELRDGMQWYKRNSGKHVLSRHP